METKICKGCGKDLPMDDYVKSRNADGHENKCKICRNKRSKENYETNKEDRKAHTKQYCIDNKEKISIRTKQYYIENKEIINKNNNQWHFDYREENLKKAKQYYTDNLEKITNRHKNHYATNKDEILERSRRYCKENPIKNAIRSQRRRTLKRSLPATLTIEQWENIKSQFNNRCAYCGQEKPLAQEHVTPLAKGGEYTINNIIPSCKSCNSSKGAKILFEWYPKFKHYNKAREKKILEFLNYDNGNQQLKII